MPLGSLIEAFPVLGAFPLLVMAFAVVQILVIIVLAAAVKNDAEMRSARRDLFLVGPWMWFVIVLVTGGYVAAFAYWLIHYSTLGYRRGNSA